MTTSRKQSRVGRPAPVSLSVLRRRTSLESALVRSLDARWVQYAAMLRKTRAAWSEKVVHDFRVATRRLISTLDLLRAVSADSRLDGLRAELRRELKWFNPLRDTQVMLLHLQNMLPVYPVLEPFATVLRLREPWLVKQIGRRVRKIPMEHMKEDVEGMRREFSRLLRNPAMRDVAATAIIGSAAAAFARAVDKHAHLDVRNPSTIHALRIAFKKIRYTLEALQPVLPGITDQQLRAMNAYQQMMGDIQDVEVLRESLREYAGRSRRALGTSLRAAELELLRRRGILINRFLGSADDLYQFWNVDFSRIRANRVPSAGA